MQALLLRRPSWSRRARLRRSGRGYGACAAVPRRGGAHGSVGASAAKGWSKRDPLDLWTTDPPIFFLACLRGELTGSRGKKRATPRIGGDSPQGRGRHGPVGPPFSGRLATRDSA